MNARTPSAGSNAIQVAHVTVLPEGANRKAEPAITWLEGHWNFVAHALRALAAGAFLTAIVLHPAIISRYVSSDGQLEKASQNLLYALEVVGVFAGVALLGLAAAARRHTFVKERIVVGVLLAAGAVLGCTVLMEAGLRLVHSVGRPLQTSRHYFFSHDSLLGWRHRPGSVATFKNQRVAINSIGLRDDDLALAGKGNSFRILFLGDSQVFGDGVSREECCPSPTHGYPTALGITVPPAKAGDIEYISSENRRIIAEHKMTGHFGTWIAPESMVGVRAVANLLVDAVEKKVDYKDPAMVQKYLIAEAGSDVKVRKYDEKAGNQYLILLDHIVY